MEKRQNRSIRLLRDAVIALCMSVAAPGCQQNKEGDWQLQSWGTKSTQSGERWTILCVEAYGPEGKLAVERLAEGLRGTRGLERDDVSTKFGTESHRLCYGNYGRELDKEAGGWHWPVQMRQEMTFIRQLALGESFPFLHCRPVPVERTQLGPPEWNLVGAAGEYTLLIAVYSEFEGRDEAAVEHVRILRDEGEEAYYYHDITRSHVCIGTFAKNDIKRTGRGVPIIDNPEYLASRKRHPYFNFNGGYVSNVNRDAGGQIFSKTKQPTRMVQIPHKVGEQLDP